jgi:hypothetical protein
MGMTDLIELAKDNKVTAVALSVIVLLGGTATITLPADRKVQALEVEVAQTLEQLDDRFMQQRIDQQGDELERLRWQIEDLNRAIHQYADDPEYQQLLRMERKILMERQQELLDDLGGVG